MGEEENGSHPTELPTCSRRNVASVGTHHFFFGCTLSMQKFQDQELNLSHSSDNAESLTHGAARESLSSFFKAKNSSVLVA